MKRVLGFLNLLDADGNLSITNIATIVAITKMAMTTQMSSTDAVALIGVLLNYAHKRVVNSSDQA